MGIKGKCAFQLVPFHQGKAGAVGKAQILVGIFPEQIKRRQTQIITDCHHVCQTAFQQGIAKGNRRAMSDAGTCYVPRLNRGTFPPYFRWNDRFCPKLQKENRTPETAWDK
jgi:hypothetical protein